MACCLKCPLEPAILLLVVPQAPPSSHPCTTSRHHSAWLALATTQAQHLAICSPAPALVMQALVVCQCLASSSSSNRPVLQGLDSKPAPVSLLLVHSRTMGLLPLSTLANPQLEVLSLVQHLSRQSSSLPCQYQQQHRSILPSKALLHSMLQQQMGSRPLEHSPLLVCAFLAVQSVCSDPLQTPARRACNTFRTPNMLVVCEAPCEAILWS